MKDILESKDLELFRGCWILVKQGKIIEYGETIFNLMSNIVSQHKTGTAYYVPKVGEPMLIGPWGNKDQQRSEVDMPNR